jgi:two-component system response regulator CitB
MDTCSLAIRNGAFDYILKPVSWKRLNQSLERFMQFAEQQRVWKIVDQQNVDSLYQLQAKNYRQDNGSKGIEGIRWRGYKISLATIRCAAFRWTKSRARRD